MNILYFAHNGMHHASETEVVAHNSNTLLWVIAASITAVGVIFTILRTLSKPSQEAQEQEEEDE